MRDRAEKDKNPLNIIGEDERVIPIKWEPSQLDRNQLSLESVSEVDSDSLPDYFDM